MAENGITDGRGIHAKDGIIRPPMETTILFRDPSERPSALVILAKRRKSGDFEIQVTTRRTVGDVQVGPDVVRIPTPPTPTVNVEGETFRMQRISFMHQQQYCLFWAGYADGRWCVSSQLVRAKHWEMPTPPLA